MLAAGGAQFAAQALGILLAVVVSHLIARRLGAGPEADAFLLGRRLVTSVGEALNQIMIVVFIPLLAARAAAGETRVRMIGTAGAAALGLGAVLAAALIVAAPAIVGLIAPRFDPATAALAAQVVTLLALALPATVATIAFSAYCNVAGHFCLPAMIRQMPRAAMALALLLGAGALAVTAAWAYTIAFLAVALLTLALALRLEGDGPAAATGRTGPAAIGRRGSAALLLTLGALAAIWLETLFAARQGVGAVALLDFSQRLGALCGNTLAAALALVVFADLSRRSAAGTSAEIGPRFGSALIAGLALMVPLQLAFLVNAAAIVDVVIAHGEFSEAGARQVTRLLRWMACAPLGALVTRMLLVRILADRGLPIVRLVGGAVALDLLARLGLFALLTPTIGLLAIPVALTVAPVVPVIFLASALRRRGPLGLGAALRSARPVLAASALGSGAIVLGAMLGPGLAGALGPVAGALPKLDSLAQLAGSGLLGGLALVAGFALTKAGAPRG
ncbi:lipid II flippase MurJ [Roseivivax sp. CAU 1761]